MSHLVKGLTAKLQLCLVSNLKQAILDILKDDEHQKIAGALMQISPIFLLAVNGNVNIKFDEYNDISEHPVFAPGMANFNELYEGMMESDPSEIMGKRVDTEMRETDDPEEKEKFDQLKAIAECFNSIADCMEDLGETFEVDISAPDYCLSTRFALHCSGVGKALSLFGMSKICDKIQSRPGFANGGDPD